MHKLCFLNIFLYLDEQKVRKKSIYQKVCQQNIMPPFSHFPSLIPSKIGNRFGPKTIEREKSETSQIH